MIFARYCKDGKVEIIPEFESVRPEPRSIKAISEFKLQTEALGEAFDRLAADRNKPKKPIVFLEVGRAHGNK